MLESISLSQNEEDGMFMCGQYAPVEEPVDPAMEQAMPTQPQNEGAPTGLAKVRPNNKAQETPKTQEKETA
jgi:hypothetical protein